MKEAIEVMLGLCVILAIAAALALAAGEWVVRFLFE